MPFRLKYQRHRVGGRLGVWVPAGPPSPGWEPLTFRHRSWWMFVRSMGWKVMSWLQMQLCSALRGVWHHQRYPNYLLWQGKKNRSTITYHIPNTPDVHGHPPPPLIFFFCQVVSTFGKPLCLSLTLCPANSLLPSFFSFSYCHLPSPPTQQAGVHSSFKIMP